MVKPNSHSLGLAQIIGIHSCVEVDPTITESSVERFKGQRRLKTWPRAVVLKLLTLIAARTLKLFLKTAKSAALLDYSVKS